MSQKVLVVDDANSIRLLVKTVLGNAGYTVAEADDGVEALKVLQNDPLIALVVSDINMPDMGGVDLLRAIRSDAKLTELPVIFMTGDNIPDLAILEELEVYAILIKPFRVDDLLQTTREALE